MSAVPVTAHQLRSEVARVLQKEPDALVIGLHAAGPWQGDGELDLGERRFAVVRADTVLEVREALADAEALARPTVVLTALEQAELGHDVVARLARSKLFPVDLWEGVKGLFKAAAARPVAPRPLPGPAPCWSTRPPDGDYAPVPAGVLDAGTAWRAILHHAFGMEDREPDLPGLLRWAARRTGAGRYLASPAELRDAARRPPGRDARGRRPGRSSTSSRPGAARDALGPGRRLRGRLRRGGGRARPPGRRRPAGAVPPQPAHPAGRRPDPGPGRPRRDRRPGRATSPSRPRATCCGPTRCSGEVQAAPLRPPRPADAAGLGAAAPPVRRGRWPPRPTPRARPPWPPARTQAPTVADHALARPAGAPRTSLERTRMALRLVRWLRHPRGARRLVRPARRRYRDELAFVDWARDALGRGRRPGRAVRRLRPARSGPWPRAGRRSTGPSPRPWPTGPAAARTPARSSASRTCWPRSSPRSLDAEDPRPPGRARRHELAGRPRAAGRPAAAPLGRGDPAGVRARRRPRSSPRSPASPSSRARACWPGPGDRGEQDDERRLFPVDPALLARCERNFPPLLFHKGRAHRGEPRGAGPAGRAGASWTRRTGSSRS